MVRNRSNNSLYRKNLCIPLFIRYVGGRFILSTGHPSSGTDGPAKTYFSCSTDGINWAAIDETGGYTVFNSKARFYDVAFGNGIYLAVGPANILVSMDGFASTAWTEKAMPNWGTLPRERNILIFDDTRNLFMLAVRNTAYYTEDGETWRYKSFGSSGLASAKCVAYGDGAFVVGMDGWGEIAYSGNGENWTRFEIKGFADATFGEDTDLIVYGNGRFVALINTGEIAYTN